MMIDLHCHMLPAIDDGSPDLETSLEMARIAAADGIEVVACTPHIYPGMYENDTAGIRLATQNLQHELNRAGISLSLVFAADAHADPALPARLDAGTVPTLNGGRYFLLEPPHHVAPPNFESFVFGLVATGYVPIITHPERLHWIEDHYPVFCRLARNGVWMQLTAGSLTGRFGDGPRYWAERMLDEGMVHMLATDAHDPVRRAPLLAEGMQAAIPWVGEEEARRLVHERPAAALENLDPSRVCPVPALAAQTGSAPSLFSRAMALLGRG